MVPIVKKCKKKKDNFFTQPSQKEHTNNTLKQ